MEGRRGLRLEIRRSLPAIAALVVCLAVAGAARASLTVRCAWPPAGGPAIRPDSIDAEVAPIVGDLDGDGLPEIVFLSFASGNDDTPGRNGVLRILSGADCHEVATVQDVGCVACFGEAACHSLDTGDPGVFCPGCTPAIADLDGDGDMEIVVLTEGDGAGHQQRAVILDHDGGFIACTPASTEFIGGVAAVALADLDGDGETEIVARDVAWHASGAPAWSHPLSGIGATTAADLDGDGRMEVTTGQVAYQDDGSTIWANGLLSGASPAVADLNLDCVPELVVTARNRQTINVVDPLTGAIRASAPIPPGDCPPRPDGQGGPPCLADVDGDCVPEIGVAGCRRYALFKYDAGPPESLQLAWEQPIDDSTSRFTGSAIFDLDGDGHAEVLYNDHTTFHVYDGVTGALEESFPNTTNTLLEMPVVADADGDGHAEILLTANDYAFCCDAGLRVLVDDSTPWMPVRPLFNEHSYHVTNVADDGTIPRVEERSWSRYNTFRVQGEPLRGDAAPVLSGVAPDATVSCEYIPPSPAPSATGGCGEIPPVVASEIRVDGACPGSYELHRTWTATDRCGRSASAEQVVTVVDDVPPELTAPPDVVATCAAAPPPTLTAADTCDPAPGVTLSEQVIAGPCPLVRTIVRTWTARDACGNEASVHQNVQVVDDGPPTIDGTPPDVTVLCTSVPPAASPSAHDGCDPAPTITFTERRIDGPCASTYELVRTWEARDACGHVTTSEQRVSVEDDGPPVLDGVPTDVTVDCGDVPPPANVRAHDGCEPSPVVTMTQTRIDGSCANEYRLVRRWECRDACGHVTSAQQAIDVVDRTPPVISGPPETACLWPPNHWMACFGPESFHPTITDDCPGEIAWRFAGCSSDQPENDLGDGDFAPDCILRDDGTICARAERQGIDPAGRHYGLAIIAVDACGNASLPTVIANIYVPHDQDPHEDCLDPTKVGIKSGGHPRW